MAAPFNNWPKVPEGPPGGPPGGEMKWPEVPKTAPKLTIEHVIRSYASTHTQTGFLQLFYDFMVKTRTFIFMSGVRDRINPPSQGALTRLGDMIQSMFTKPTNEGRIAVLFDALAYLKANYASLFPQNRLIGAYNAQTRTFAPSRIVDPDDYFIAKWRKIVQGGDYTTDASNLQKGLAALKYEGGKTRRRRGSRVAARQKARKTTRHRA
jgi:hypothetical protein